VAVWIPDEGRVVVGVVLREHPGRVEHFCPELECRLVERVDLVAATGLECDVELAVLSSLRRAEPEGARPGTEEPDGITVAVPDPDLQRRQNRLVERRGGGDITDLETDVIDHESRFAHPGTVMTGNRQLTRHGFVAHAASVDPFLLRLFQRQIAAQCFAAMLASETAINALSPPAPSRAMAQSSSPDPLSESEPLNPPPPNTRIPPHQDVFWASVQNCLTAVANISKACWGEDLKYRKARKPLRKSLGIKKDSPLRPMAMRNNFENFDEQIDEWFATSTNRIHVDRIIGPASLIGGVDRIDMFRVFDPTTAEVVLWGERYRLKALMDEVTKLYPLARAQADKPV
jgi:hypothetical protein